MNRRRTPQSVSILEIGFFPALAYLATTINNNTTVKFQPHVNLMPTLLSSYPILRGISFVAFITFSQTIKQFKKGKLWCNRRALV